MDQNHPKPTISQKIGAILEDDQIRLLFIVILIIGLILMITGFKGASIFLILGFGLVSVLCIFKPSSDKLVENFICDSFVVQPTEVTFCNVSSENCQIKFRNSTRNKK
jgi:hypothetical protein